MATLYTHTHKKNELEWWGWIGYPIDIRSKQKIAVTVNCTETKYNKYIGMEEKMCFYADNQFNSVENFVNLCFFNEMNEQKKKKIWDALQMSVHL